MVGCSSSLQVLKIMFRCCKYMSLHQLKARTNISSIIFSRIITHIAYLKYIVVKTYLKGKQRPVISSTLWPAIRDDRQMSTVCECVWVCVLSGRVWRLFAAAHVGGRVWPIFEPCGNVLTACEILYSIYTPFVNMWLWWWPLPSTVLYVTENKGS